MSAGGYVVGVAALVAVVASAVVVGRSARRLLLPALTGAPAVAAALLLGYSFLVVLGELLGTLGLFSRLPLVVTAAAVAAVLWALQRRVPLPAPVVRARAPVQPVDVVAMLCVAIVVAEIVVGVAETARTGVLFIDALGYHLPLAAHFATTHSTTGLLQVQAGNGENYYPLDDELLRGIALSLFARDLPMLFLGPLSALLTFLAAWWLGSMFGRGSLAVCAVAPVIAIGGSFFSNGINDWSATWPLLAAACLIAAAIPDPGPARGRLTLLAVAGLGIGLSVGTKLSDLPVAAALLVAAAVATRPRLRAFGMLLAGTLVTGAYWFVRDLVLVGSPIPGTHVPGFPQVPMSLISQAGYSVAHYLGQWSVITHWFRPGLRVAFGPAWAAFLLLPLAGIVAAAWRRRPAVLRVLAVTCTVGIAGYLVTPTTAFGLEGQPVLFQYNLRYAWPTLVVGFLCVALAVPGRWLPLPLAVGFLALAITVLPHKWAFTDTASYRTVVLSVAVAVLGALALAVARSVGPAPARVPRPLLGGAAALVVVGLLAAAYPLEQFYARHRYAVDTVSPKQYPGVAAETDFYADTTALHAHRIGVVALPIYPFLGPAYGSRVTYLGQELPQHAFENYTTCRAFEQAVLAAHVSVVVVRNTPATATHALHWLLTDPGAAPVVRSFYGAAFRVEPQFGRDGCRPAVPSGGVPHRRHRAGG